MNALLQRCSNCGWTKNSHNGSPVGLLCPDGTGFTFAEKIPVLRGQTPPIERKNVVISRPKKTVCGCCFGFEVVYVALDGINLVETPCPRCKSAYFPGFQDAAGVTGQKTTV